MSKKKKINKQARREDTYTRSNAMISAKGRTTLFGNKLIAIGLYKIQRGDCTTTKDGGNIEVSMPASEIKELLGLTGNSIYKALKDVAPRIISYSIGYEDQDNKIFSFINVFTKASYENGIFKLVFNGDLKSYLVEIPNRFTVLQLDLMLKWRNSFSFRLYELLLSKAYGRSSGQYEITINLAELKFIMGCYDANKEGAVKEILDKSNSPDYELAEKMIKPTVNKQGKVVESVYKVFYDFKRIVIEPAIKEINGSEEALIHVDGTRNIAGGVGGKVRKLTFYVSKKSSLPGEPVDEKAEDDFELSETDKFKIKSATFLLFEKYHLEIEDIDEICESARYQLDRIKDAYNIFENSSSEIHNIVGFIKTAIEKEYKPNVSRVSKKSEEKSPGSFNDFEQREYNYGALEKFLLNPEQTDEQLGFEHLIKEQSV